MPPVQRTGDKGIILILETRYSTIDKSEEASDPLASRSKRRKSQLDTVDSITKQDLEDLRKELQLLKIVRLGQDADQDTDNNLLSLAIQAKMVHPTLRVPKEKFSGTTNPTDHIIAFESHMDLYGMNDVIKCRAFPATFKRVARSWYDSLPVQSIVKFKQLKKTVYRSFHGKQKVTQEDDQPVVDYPKSE